MKYSKLAAGVILAIAAAGASAANINSTFTLDLNSTTNFGNKFLGQTGKTFLDTYNFTFSSKSDLDSALTSIATSSALDLDITQFGLYSGSALIAQGEKLGTGTLDLWTLSGLGISGGSYSLQVGGTILGTKGGSYGGNVNIVPVSEPGTWGIIGVGIAAMGFIGRRRQTASAPLAGAAA